MGASLSSRYDERSTKPAIFEELVTLDSDLCPKDLLYTHKTCSCIDSAHAISAQCVYSDLICSASLADNGRIVWVQ